MTPAEIALSTAHSFFKDVDDELQKDAIESPQDLLNTLALGSRKLVEAEKLDPRATLKADDGMRDVTIQDIKAMGVGLEGKIQLFSGEFKKAIATFDRAIALQPNFAIVWASKSAAHAQLMQKKEAVAAIRKAIELDPENIDYQKVLAENEAISGSEIAAAKVMNAGKRTFGVMKLMFYLFMLLPFIMLIGGLMTGSKDAIISGVLFFVIFGMASMAWDKVKSFFS